MAALTGLPPEAPRRIKALDQDVVNKIAAGEIIVAPVHALKELMENAVDAGSTSLEVLVKDGGLKLLQITDDGCGINRDDLPILCERFTTSKLKSFEDLTSIGTYGFRGEALASISHIAHLQITTKVRESSCAYRAYYADGRLAPPKPGQSADPKPCAGRQGTQITVEDLFYNVPTRRRAFRSASEEYTKILDMVGSYAIHCTGVAFSCKKHGDAAAGISVQPNATPLDRIRIIHGSSTANELIKLETEDATLGFKATGYMSNANHSSKRTTFLLFINHRAVESPALRKAVEQTYQTFLPKGGHPFMYLSLDIDPQRVDVNVHPTKRHVNFLNEDEIIEKICEHISLKLGNVDTSRTFMTQSLLPGAKVPTISIIGGASPGRSPKVHVDPDASQQVQQTPIQRTPANKPYENNLVRTDSRARKITTMLPPALPRAGSSPTRKTPAARTPSETSDYDDPMGGSVEYTVTDRETTVCRLASIKALRANVRDGMHNGLTEAFNTHTFVGIIDHKRRLAAIQSGVKLYLVDYGMTSAEYFYQLGLTDFGNFGYIQLDPPLKLTELLLIAAESERTSEMSDDASTLDWDEVIDRVRTHLLSKREMLAEYFSLEITEDGDLLSLPLLMKGYTPSMAKLPRFLLRLGPYVDWSDEEGCFRTFLRELAAWYVPESLPNAPWPQKKSQTREGGDELEDDNEQHMSTDEDAETMARRKELGRAIEHVLFPAFKARLIATKGMLKGMVEIADLKGLYRVFERC